MQNPPIGWIVHFWPNADPAGEPMPGVVVRCGRDGLVKLNLFLENGGETLSTAEFVHHMDDPWVEMHRPELMQPRRGRVRGAWDWIPGLKPRKDVLREATAPKTESDTKSDRRQKGEAKIRDMLDHGADESEIIMAVRTFGLGTDAVKEYIQQVTANA